MWVYEHNSRHSKYLNAAWEVTWGSRYGKKLRKYGSPVREDLHAKTQLSNPFGWGFLGIYTRGIGSVVSAFSRVFFLGVYWYTVPSTTWSVYNHFYKFKGKSHYWDPNWNGYNFNLIQNSTYIKAVVTHLQRYHVQE